MQTALIDTGKHPDEPLDASFWFWLPSESPYGNFQLKLLKMHQRLDEANRRLIESFSYWDRARTDLYMPTIALERHVNANEQALYLMGRAADDMIALTWCLYRWEVTGRYPDEITVDGISAALAHGGNKSLKFWQDHHGFLARLNDVGNAYRHCFVNSDLNLVGGSEPRIHSLSLNRKKPKSGARFQDVSLAALVKEFSKFNAAGMHWLREFSERHRPQTQPGDSQPTTEKSTRA